MCCSPHQKSDADIRLAKLRQDLADHCVSEIDVEWMLRREQDLSAVNNHLRQELTIANAKVHRANVARDEARNELEQSRARSQRLTDLVRYKRSELFDDGLISKNEYTELLRVKGAVERLEGYDAIKAELSSAEELVDECKRVIGLMLPFVVCRCPGGATKAGSVESPRQCPFCAAWAVVGPAPALLHPSDGELLNAMLEHGWRIVHIKDHPNGPYHIWRPGDPAVDVVRVASGDTPKAALIAAVEAVKKDGPQ